ncbi:MAG: DUF2130 domain-containing protein [Cytophagaceae bacterium]|nr:DUF2130 domain-containing protein [Cytophagaceae bacterium]MDW8457275.1 DUF2130 domain-containing protein [Cytophagaceae bacterium]
MEQQYLLTCPKCGHRFNAEQTIAQNVEERLRSEFNKKFKSLLEQKEEEFKKKSEEDKKRIEELLKNKIKEDFQLQLKLHKEELEQKRKENLELKAKEFEMMKQAQQLEEKMQEMELQMKKKFLEERKNIEAEIKQKLETDNQLQLREKDMLIEQLQRHLQDMQKKVEQGSMQAQGEAQELALEEILKSSFPFDIIQEVGKGVKGADIIQTVRNAAGIECGKIIYESKRTKDFQKEWIEKLKADCRSHKADIAVIISQALPADIKYFGQKDNVWISSFATAKNVALILRQALIHIHEIRSAQENKGDKMQMLYHYLTGTEFTQHVLAIVEAFTYMRESIIKEKTAMEKLWKEREKQAEKAILNISNLYGSIKGIAGNAVPEIKQLDINNLAIE